VTVSAWSRAKRLQHCAGQHAERGHSAADRPVAADFADPDPTAAAAFGQGTHPKRSGAYFFPAAASSLAKQTMKKHSSFQFAVVSAAGTILLSGIFAK
jgi:hypothetical protein